MDGDNDWRRGMLERYRELLTLTDDARLVELLKEMVQSTEESLTDGNSAA